jgi:prepilin-type N-terminal cleavage/methylation domain-containing protein
MNKKGFSLIEIVIVIFILIICLFAVSNMFFLSFDKNELSYYKIKAAQLALSNMEYLKSISADSVLLLNNNTENYGSISGYEKFKRLTRSKIINSDTNLILVETNIFWKSNNKELNYKLTGVNYY